MVKLKFLKTSNKKLKVKKFNQINATFNFFLSKKYKILKKIAWIF